MLEPELLHVLYGLGEIILTAVAMYAPFILWFYVKDKLKERRINNV